MRERGSVGRWMELPLSEECKRWVWQEERKGRSVRRGCSKEIDGGSATRLGGFDDGSIVAGMSFLRFFAHFGAPFVPSLLCPWPRLFCRSQVISFPNFDPSPYFDYPIRPPQLNLFLCWCCVRWLPSRFFVSRLTICP
ncbi:hypothetical protein FA13DRAFT_1031960 [Coprinellus micaceus]|uniref:Uncharacterized protein n=1 Tax=Coprinellus micaceus TaxID=71717 RepID=A0A4Y7RNK3_COPMI|nr:hypothetical protein FA13DRAFT_1031960 [Coprinellus micaceus]